MWCFRAKTDCSENKGTAGIHSASFGLARFAKLFQFYEHLHNNNMRPKLDMLYKYTADQRHKREQRDRHNKRDNKIYIRANQRN
jgi:hypothetical protein